MESLDDLESEVSATAPEILIPELLIVIDALRKFNAVRKACFGNELLDSYREDIEKFKAAYVLLGIKVTTKAHIIFDHVGDYCAKRGRGLGPDSEQAR